MSTASLAAVGALALIAPAYAQSGAAAPTTGAPAPANAQTVDELVVTAGFRSSLEQSLNTKRLETAAVDSIVAEDIGKFPDANLAESMQRISGVALSRGDGGEGRGITVRGLSSQFTRVRVNGMEASAQTGASDIYGNGNSGRSFDFNVFPTEIFNSLTVRKTPSADVEEGSLGATIDLEAPHPLNYAGDAVLTGSVRGIYNTVAKDYDPRISLLASKKFADGKFGLLGSLAYGKRHTREVGYSATRNLPAWVNGGFCSPIGVTPQNSANNAARGTTATNCATGVPRTGSVAAYNEVMKRLGPLGQPGGGAFFPRIPRYVNIDQNAERTAASLSFEWKPSDDTQLTVDGLYSRYKVERQDDYISLISFARAANNNGQPMTSIRDIEIDSLGTVIYGLYDGVDIRSEGRFDEFTTEFGQFNVKLKHNFTENLAVTAYAGKSRSTFDSPQRASFSIDSNNRNGVSVDFRGGRTIPIINFGFDVSDPTQFGYGPIGADAQQVGTFGDLKRDQYTLNSTYELEGEWSVNSYVKVKAGAQRRVSDYNSAILVPDTTKQAVETLPAGVTVASLTRQVSGFGKLLGGGSPASWAAGDLEKWRSAVNFSKVAYCGVECGQSDSRVLETVSSAYLMASFDTAELLPMPVRGDFGMRYVRTRQESSGYSPVAAPAGSYYPTTGALTEVGRTYKDWLPSANLVIEVAQPLLVRLSAAKVMSRPELGSLIPNSVVSVTQRTGTVSNPLLDPVRANTYDASIEWYPRRGALLSVAYFRKDIGTYIQAVSSLIPFNQLGLPLSLLANTNTPADELIVVNRATNTPGGKLQGVEVSGQLRFDFLPGFLANTGALASYTRVSSTINYILSSTNGVPVSTTRDDLVGLSKNGLSGTLYYEGEKFSVRSTANYRGGYIREIPSGSNDSDIVGNKATLYIDASASYDITDQLKVLFEVQNLTKERNELFVDSIRKDPLYETEVGRTFTLGVTYRY